MMKGSGRTMTTRQPTQRRKRTVLSRPAVGPLVIMLFVVAGSLAACGGSPSNGVTSPRSAAHTKAADALRYSRCMRSNGVINYPEPTSNGLPRSLKGINLNSHTFQKAYSACRKYAPNGKGGPPAPSEAQLRAALAFAQCMRKHGFPQFPDPLGTAPDRPNLTLGQGIYFPLNSTTNFQSPPPMFKRAAKACGVQLP